MDSLVTCVSPLQILGNRNPKQLPWPTVQSYTMQLCRALHHLHSHCIIHRSRGAAVTKGFSNSGLGNVACGSEGAVGFRTEPTSRDVKSDNIFLTGCCTEIRLSDFGTLDFTHYVAQRIRFSLTRSFQRCVAISVPTFFPLAWCRRLLLPFSLCHPDLPHPGSAVRFGDPVELDGTVGFISPGELWLFAGPS